MKRILQAIKLDKIAAVDAPCQEPAVMTIMKRKQDGEPYWKRKYSSEQRKDYADKGIAMPGGEFPIPDKAALKDALHDLGRASSYSGARRHIIQRAKALGAMDQLPDKWEIKKVSLTDRIVKQILAGAYEDIMDCAKECSAAEAICPMVEVLKESFISIHDDADLDSVSKFLEMRNSVEKFLDSIRGSNPQAPAELEDAMDVSKGIRDLTVRIEAFVEKVDGYSEAAKDARQKKINKRIPLSKRMEVMRAQFELLKDKYGINPEKRGKTHTTSPLTRGRPAPSYAARSRQLSQLHNSG